MLGINTSIYITVKEDLCAQAELRYYYENGWYDALECVEKLPPDDVRPVVRGRWEIQAVGIDGKDVFCSVCKCGSNRPYWPFCPMCGADMKSEKEDKTV